MLAAGGGYALAVAIIYYLLSIMYYCASAVDHRARHEPVPAQQPQTRSSVLLSLVRPAPSAQREQAELWASSGLWATCQKPNAISGGPVARCPAVAGFPFSRFCLPPPSLPASCIYAVRLVAVARVSDQCRMSCASIVSHIHRSHQPQCRPAFVLSSH